jgi:hypothetical protein
MNPHYEKLKQEWHRQDERKRRQRQAMTWFYAVVIASIILFAVIQSFAAGFEMVVVSTTPVGLTSGLCFGTNQPDQRALIQVLDNDIWFTLHSATATPSGSSGFKALAGTYMIVDNASGFRAVRVSADARLAVLCVPQIGN